MLQFTRRSDDGPVWVNPRHVAAVVPLGAGEGVGCTLLLTGGFGTQIRETAEDVTSRINKRLNAY